MIGRRSNLLALLGDLRARGVICELDSDGVFRAKAKRGILTEGEKVGLDVIRTSLTELLREEAGLCRCCEQQALLPANSPLWCQACWRAGRWKDGLPTNCAKDEQVCDIRECESANE